MYKIVVQANVTVTEEIQILTEYGDYYDSFTDEVTDTSLLKKLEFTEEDNLVDYLNEDFKSKLQNSSYSTFLVLNNQLVINSNFVAIKRLTKTELDKLKEEVSAQYSNGWFENGLERNIYNGTKYKDYYLSIDYPTTEIKQIKLNIV